MIKAFGCTDENCSGTVDTSRWVYIELNRTETLKAAHMCRKCGALYSTGGASMQDEKGYHLFMVRGWLCTKRDNRIVVVNGQYAVPKDRISMSVPRKNIA